MSDFDAETQADLDEIDEIIDKAIHPDRMDQEDAIDFLESVMVAADTRLTAIKEDMAAEGG